MTTSSTGKVQMVIQGSSTDALKLDALQCLVLDEADEMLRMGFAEDVEWVLEQSPAERQIALFSATMPDEIRRIAKRHDPFFLPLAANAHFTLLFMDVVELDAG
mgnify:CR=1 FL=1